MNNLERVDLTSVVVAAVATFFAVLCATWFVQTGAAWSFLGAMICPWRWLRCLPIPTARFGRTMMNERLIATGWRDQINECDVVVCRDGTLWHDNGTQKWTRIPGPPADDEAERGA